MKIVYINTLDADNKWVWIKCFLHNNNSLDLSLIVKKLNQYFINNHPDDVFFSLPNVLLKKKTPMNYVSYNGKIREISTKDRSCRREAHFYSEYGLYTFFIECINGTTTKKDSCTN